MARGGAGVEQGTEAGQMGLGFAGTAGTNAQGLYGTLAPQLTQEAMAPPGMSPSDLAAINTAGQQSAGGGQAAAVGQGALQSARTRNAGGADAAIAQSARTAGETLSKGALGTQIMNAHLKENQRQEGLKGMESLYGENLGAERGNLGATAEAIRARTGAASQNWDWARYILDPAMSGRAGGGGGE